MLAAICSVVEDGLSGNRAADMHGVPRSTLKDRLGGRVVHGVKPGVKPGPQPYLSADEESTGRVFDSSIKDRVWKD